MLFTFFSIFFQPTISIDILKLVQDCLDEALNAIKLIEEEHEVKKLEVESDSNNHGIYLSDAPRIFRISFGSHLKVFCDEKVDFFFM
jgi:hypothetical protein